MLLVALSSFLAFSLFQGFSKKTIVFTVDLFYVRDGKLNFLIRMLYSCQPKAFESGSESVYLSVVLTVFLSLVIL